MSTPVKNESPEPRLVKSESLDDTALTSDEATCDPPESSPIGSPSQPSRRPRNPFILFRTWYIKQGYLKQVTSSGSELSKITGKLWKAMHEDDRKFWAQQSKQEREASQGRVYAPAAAPRARGSRSRKKATMASGARYCPMAMPTPDPLDDRMNNIVQLLIAGKTGDEIEGELRNKRTPSAGLPQAGIPSPTSSSLPLLAPVPRSARASLSLDALELQSHLSNTPPAHEPLSNSVSPQTSLHDLPETPERCPSGYNTPLEQVVDFGTRTIDQWSGQMLSQDTIPDFLFDASSLHARSGSLDTESWSMAGTPDVSGIPHYPMPTSYKEAPQLGYPQGGDYFNTPAPYYDLNYPPTGYNVPGYSGYSVTQPTSDWHGSEHVSLYGVPGYSSLTHTGDLVWPPEWVNDSY